MGYSSWGHKELDTTEQLTFPRFILCLMYLYVQHLLQRQAEQTHTHGIHLGSGQKHKHLMDSASED